MHKHFAKKIIKKNYTYKLTVYVIVIVYIKRYLYFYNSMTKLFYLLFTSTILCTHFGEAQTKTYTPTKINTTIKIDGKPNDIAWQNVATVTDFVIAYPDYGKAPSKQTSVKIAYDNTAIYVLATMYDDPKNIRRQLSQRDAIERQDADVFTIGLDTYQDRQNGFSFSVTAAGVQGDSKITGNDGNDNSWDAVWESAVATQQDAWIAEFKIPLSAIRFAKKNDQNWGLQLTRFLRSKNESITWSPQDPNINGTINQWGNMNNLQNIIPPLRLSFLPYISTGVRNSPTIVGRKKENLVSGGMDVKWGINESFTVDMTLVPDFAQVQSDNIYLNLSPFQVKFDDYRPFFTEGTELFNKANLFYSRRIGAEPSGVGNVLNIATNNTNYTIKKNPGITRLYNATKLSGRTKNNVGIGIFNAVTAPMKAVLYNNTTKQDTVITTEVLTNYNVFVIDKALKNRSSITFTNTNAMRQGNSRNANVAAVDATFFDKKNNYRISGSARVSNIWGTNGKYDGYNVSVSGGKVSGKWQAQAYANVESDNYDPNDLGFLYNNNSVDQGIEVSLKYPNPTKKYLSHSYNISLQNTYLYKPFLYAEFKVETNAFFLFKNFWDLSIFTSSNPGTTYDYFEARTPGAKMNRFPYLFVGMRGSTDSRKKLFGSWFIGGAEGPVKDDPYYKVDIGGRYRFSSKFQMNVSVQKENDKGQFGYTHRDNISTLVTGYKDPVIAFRHLRNSNVIMGAQYNFTPRMNWTIRLRHNWTNLENRTFHKLNTDGTLYAIPFRNNYNRNFNVFNVDMFYTWDFKWGSRLTFGWKNALGQNVYLNPYEYSKFTKNFGAMFNNPHSNEVTLKVVYFLDYLTLKK